MASRSTATALRAPRAPDHLGALLALSAKAGRKVVASLVILHDAFVEAQAMAYAAQRRHNFTDE
jgi:hypothetical protein